MKTQIIKILICIILTTLIGCSNKRVDNTKENQVSSKKTIIIPDISAIDSKFPLILSKINFKDSKNIIRLNDRINNMIEQAIKDYYFNECSGDSAQTYFSIEDVYFNTIRLHDSLQTIFIVIFKYLPSGLVNSKILFYNNISKQFIGKTIDYNIHAMYDFDNGNLKQSNLKELFKITLPDIELVDNKIYGIRDYKFTRLYHNGTANAIETTILQVSENRIDTLDFEQKWIQ